MSSVIISGDVSGTVTLQAPSAAGSTVLTLPSTSMNIGNGGGNVSTNTAFGSSTLAANTTGAYNTALGANSLATNTTGNGLTALGNTTLYANTTGSENTAIGGSSATYAALRFNTTGSYNVAVGGGALVQNTTASNNTAVGYQALYSNTTGVNSTAIGYQALYSQTTSTYANTAVGYQAGSSLTTGYGNTLIGHQAGEGLTTGSGNTFIGPSNSSTSNPSGISVTTGSNNTILGGYTGNQGGLDIRTASGYIVLSDGAGNPRLFVDNSGYINCAGAYSNTSAAAANATFNASGYFSRSTSALKYKQDIRDVEDFDISVLRPVRYKSKCEGDDQTKDHLGLIADEAAEAGFEELVTRGVDGEIEGFQYERLTVVLLKKLQILESKVDAQAAEIAALKGAA